MYFLFIIHLRIDLAHDVFGRERHRLHKDDMGGVGTFDKECRTLYVGGLGNRSTLEKLLWIDFGEWGEIEVAILFVLMDNINYNSEYFTDIVTENELLRVCGRFIALFMAP